MKNINLMGRNIRCTPDEEHFNLKIGTTLYSPKNISIIKAEAEELFLLKGD